MLTLTGRQKSQKFNEESFSASALSGRSNSERTWSGQDKYNVKIPFISVKALVFLIVVENCLRSQMRKGNKKLNVRGTQN